MVRFLVQALVRQQLLRTQQRMKAQADKKSTEREFVVGDMVFLKLQPYVQATVAHRENHKLSFCYFGPFPVTKRIGEVAYQLQLSVDSRMHQVFHVSQLKKIIPPKYQVHDVLPSSEAHLQVPFECCSSAFVLWITKPLLKCLLNGVDHHRQQRLGKIVMQAVDSKGRGLGSSLISRKGNVSELTDKQKVIKIDRQRT